MPKKKQTSITHGLSEVDLRGRARNTALRQKTTAELAGITLWNQIYSIFSLLLLGSGVVSYCIGAHPDAYIFFAIFTVNTAIGFSQEFKSSRASEALQNLITHTATVIRSGKHQTIPCTEIVEGDIMLLTAGDVITVDARIRTERDALIDSSIRTGETLPQEVRVGDILLAGSSIASGTLVVEVTGVGSHNSLRAYALALDSVKKDSNFEKFIASLSRALLLLTIACVAVTGVYGVLIVHSFGALDFVLYAISMVIGVVPESLPLIITFMLSREALLLAKEHVIIKRLPALQELGAVTHFFTDKTGTITQNAMEIAGLYDIDDVMLHAHRIACATYERTPLDTAFDNASCDTRYPSPETPEVPRVTPYSHHTGFAIFQFDDRTVIRGKCEEVLAACSVHEPHLMTAFINAEKKGLRVIAFASKTHHGKVFTLHGLVYFEDPLKKDAGKAYRSLTSLAIDTKIITGDSPRVAAYILHKLNRGSSLSQVIDMTEEVPPSAKKPLVYAHCKPEQKLSLINTYLDTGVVAFLGEGINDALALKRADVGIAVHNASDIARQSADIILLDKNLSSIAYAIQMSRKTYVHIITYLTCTLTGNIGTLFSLTLVTLWFKDLPMLPIQILLNNILTDVPLLLLTKDSIEKRLLKRPAEQNIKRLMHTICTFALLSSVFDILYFLIAKHMPIDAIRTGWFVFSVLAELILVLSLRTQVSFTRAPNMPVSLRVAMLVCAVFAIASPYIPYVNNAFHLVPLPTFHLFVMGLILLAYFAINELFKRLLSHRTR